jgi:hypothetical protein
MTRWTGCVTGSSRPRTYSMKASNSSTVSPIDWRRRTFEQRGVELDSMTMTPEEKEDLRARAAELRRMAADARRRRVESNKKIERALATLRELSGRR